MIAFLVLSLYSIPFISCLDSETNERMFKFTTISGAPSSLNGSSQESLSDYSECIQKCLDDEECVLVHQESPDAPCFFFPWGSVGGVRNNASGGEGVTSFKVFTDQPACDLNAHYLLNGQTYAIFPNDTEKYLWRIDTSEDGWTITYLPCPTETDTKCGNWGSLRPYPDSCNNECKLTMIHIYAEPGNIKRSGLLAMNTTWMDCEIKCYLHWECTLAHYNENTGRCIFYSYAGLSVLTKRGADEGHRMAIKAPLSNVTCKWSTEQLLEDTYFLPYQRMYTRNYREYFRIQNMGDSYLMMFYRDDSMVYERTAKGCPSQFLPPISGKIVGCMEPFRSTNISQLEAKQICERMGGHLMVETTQLMTTFRGYFQFDALETNKIWEMGVISNNRFWMGLEKIDDCSKAKNQTLCQKMNGWVWSEPGWQFIGYNEGYTDPPMSWAQGEPSSDPKKRCAYMRMGVTSSPYSYADVEYKMVSAECDQRDLDGFICGVYTQSVNNVRTYQSVSDEYGKYEKNCCLITWERRDLMDFPPSFVPMNPNSTKDEL